MIKLVVLLVLPWWGSAVLWIVAILFLLMFTKSLLGVIYIGQEEVGIVEKKFAFGVGKKLGEGQIIALNGEAGIQADVLPPGLHFGFWPWKFKVKKGGLTVVPEGQFAQVVAIAGKQLLPGRNLGNIVECENFQDAKKFLNANGQKGQQLGILTAGKYRINTNLFQVQSAIDLIEVPHEKIGIVTVREGKPITDGEMAKDNPNTHNHYQDPQAFINADGFKGLQIPVLQAGRYAINPWFAKVENIGMTEVPVGHCGVVISYVGNAGIDQSGNDVNARIVADGEKGVWKTPLQTGKYPINTYVRNVVIVPITQLTLYWADSKTAAHNLDKDLSTIILRTSDAFDVAMDVAVIIHIPLDNAPKIVANFGSIENLISQVLQSTISSYFRNSAQSVLALQMYQKRKEIQAEAGTYIKGILTNHFVECRDVLIDDVVLPKELTKTLTDRQIAVQEKETYKIQTEAQDQKKELKSAEALAEIQGQVVKASQGVTIAEREGEQDQKRATGKAAAVKTEAEAEAFRIREIGKATGEATTATGTADAKVIELKVKSMGDGYTQVLVAEKLMSGTKALVPQILITGGGAEGNGSISGLLALKLVEDVTRKTAELKTPVAPATPAASETSSAAPAEQKKDEKSE